MTNLRNWLIDSTYSPPLDVEVWRLISSGRNLWVGADEHALGQMAMFGSLLDALGRRGPENGAFIALEMVKLAQFCSQAVINEGRSGFRVREFFHLRYHARS